MQGPALSPVLIMYKKSVILTSDHFIITTTSVKCLQDILVLPCKTKTVTLKTSRRRLQGMSKKDLQDIFEIFARFSFTILFFWTWIQFFSNQFFIKISSLYIFRIYCQHSLNKSLDLNSTTLLSTKLVYRCEKLVVSTLVNITDRMSSLLVYLQIIRKIADTVLISVHLSCTS